MCYKDIKFYRILYQSTNKSYVSTEILFLRYNLLKQIISVYKQVVFRLEHCNKDYICKANIITLITI